MWGRLAVQQKGRRVVTTGAAWDQGQETGRGMQEVLNQLEEKRAAARAGGMLPASWRRRVPVVGEWCDGLVLPDLPRRSFLEQWEQRQRGGRANAAPPANPRQSRS